MRDNLNLDQYKELLEERHAAYQQDREAQRRESAPIELDQTKVGRLSRMDAIQQQSMAQATARRAEVEIQRIRTALNRIHTGDYGYCVKCDEEIPEGRLRVDPATLLCIDCARAGEEKNPR